MNFKEVDTWLSSYLGKKDVDADLLMEISKRAWECQKLFDLIKSLQKEILKNGTAFNKTQNLLEMNVDCFYWVASRLVDAFSAFIYSVSTHKKSKKSLHDKLQVCIVRNNLVEHPERNKNHMRIFELGDEKSGPILISAYDKLRLMPKKPTDVIPKYHIYYKGNQSGLEYRGLFKDAEELLNIFQSEIKKSSLDL